MTSTPLLAPAGADEGAPAVAPAVGVAADDAVDDPTRLVVREAGPVDAPAVVLVHGIGMSGRYFRPLTSQLAADRHVLVPDLPGFGSSPRPARAPDVPALAATLLRVLAERGVVPDVLVGHSMGAQVVVEALRQAPGCAARGVLIGPVVDPLGGSPLRQAVRLLRDARYETAAVNATVALDWLRTGPRWYGAVLPHMLAYDTRSAVAEVAAPLLVVRGRDDTVCSRAWGTELARTARVGRLREVPAAGHAAMATHPRLVASWVREAGAWASA